MSSRDSGLELVTTGIWVTLFIHWAIPTTSDFIKSLWIVVNRNYSDFWEELRWQLLNNFFLKTVIGLIVNILQLKFYRMFSKSYFTMSKKKLTNKIQSFLFFFFKKKPHIYVFFLDSKSEYRPLRKKIVREVFVKKKMLQFNNFTLNLIRSLQLLHSIWIVDKGWKL